MKDVQFIINRIKELAKEKDISINKLLSECRLNSTLITKSQQRGTIPSVKAISAIADYFDVSIEYLIGTQDTLAGQSAFPAGSKFGKTLRQFRKSQNIMQKDIAQIWGIGASTLSQYETGKREPDLNILLKIADYFHVSVDYLLGHTNPVMVGKPSQKIISNEFRGKALESELWVYGAYIYAGSTDKAYIQMYDGNSSLSAPTEINPYTVGRYTQGCDMQGNNLYEDDLITGSNGIAMVIRYGEYQAFCPADKAFMRSIGFYAEAPGYPDMPIGNTDGYATKIGNLHDNPHLWA